MKSPYKEYAEYRPVEVFRTRPSVLGFLRRYLLGLVSLLVYIVTILIGESYIFLRDYLVYIYFILLVSALIISWVLRAKESLSSTFLSLFLFFAFGYKDLQNMTMTDIPVKLSDIFAKFGLASNLIAICITLIAVEMYRKSINYVLTDLGIEIRGGVWRSQIQSIPYNYIGRVILEQSLIGRIFNYGTIVIVSPAEWGSEYYTRGIDTSISQRSMSLGVQYSRTLKEISRDPLKCLYGVKNPTILKNIIEKMITAPYRAEIDQARYLKEIRDMFKKGD